MFIHKRNLQVMGRKKKIYVYICTNIKEGNYYICVYICIYMMMMINFYHFILYIFIDTAISKKVALVIRDA